MAEPLPSVTGAVPGSPVICENAAHAASSRQEMTISENMRLRVRLR